jgi:phage terminase large subunit
MISRRIPEAYEFLGQPSRYKVLYGGRGGAKSWQIAEELIFRGLNKPLRILCARELQVSIADSVHKLLADTIRRHGLEWFYTILQTTIRGQNGTEFMFKGMKHNATEIKSTESVDICWVEEAEKVSGNSWELLLPTIRKDESEIWISFNPKYPTDPTYRLFVEQKRENAIVRKVSWRDNPWFPDVLRDEMEHMKKADELAYQHIWEGNFDLRYSGSVYAVWMAKAHEQGRVIEGIFDPNVEVHTAWDLGYDDMTAIWFWQNVGKELRLIDYYEKNGQDIKHYCDYVRLLGKKRGFKYGKHYVPHDAANKLLAAGGRSIVQQAYTLGVKMSVVPATSQQNGIEAARKVLETSWFDPVACAKGMECLKAYEFPFDEDKKTFKSTPLHNWASHGSDAFEIIGQVLSDKIKSKPDKKVRWLHETTADEVFWPKDTVPVHTNERI